MTLVPTGFPIRGANPLALTLAISAFCIVGDYFLKRASQAAAPFRTLDFGIGLLVFASTAAGWILILPHRKLGVVGAVYGVSTVLFMALLGWLVFGESLRPVELIGMGLGVASIVLLARFA